VVAFRNQFGAYPNILARRFDDSGMPLGGEFQVNTYDTNAAQEYLASAADDDGDFVVVWFRQDDTSGSMTGHVFGRKFASSGAAVGGEFKVNVFTTAHGRNRPTVAMSAAGDFVVAWVDDQQVGVFARRFLAATGPVLDIDKNGTLEPLTDGLLVVRYLFGFTGNALVAGAYDTVGCMRCTAGDMLAHLVSIDGQLDIDGDLETDALTDGLLVLRWLFGFTGNALITGAYDTMHCTRCTAEAIAGHIAGLAT
jgi:hypothetical protein